MFFAPAAALAALPELGPRTRAAVERAAARRRDAAAARTRAGATRSLRRRPRRSACACRTCRRSRGVARPVLQSSANLAGAPDARRARRGARGDPRRRRPRARRRRAAGHAVDRDRPDRVRGRGALRDRAPGARRGRRRRRRAWYVGEPAAASGDPPMTDLQPDYFDRPLADVDPEVAEAMERELGRQQATLEMIASENFVPQAVLEARAACSPTSTPRAIPEALLRRLRVRRHRRAAGDRPREGAVRSRARERPAARGRAGQHGRLPRAAGARATRSWAFAAARRPPHARDEDQRVGPALRHRAYEVSPRDAPDRHGRGRADRAASGARSCCSPAGRRIPASSTSSASARSPTRSARC